MDATANQPAASKRRRNYHEDKYPRYRFSLRRKIANPDRDKWISFHPNFGKLRLTFSPYTYFDERAEISSYLTTLVAIAGAIVTLSAGLPSWLFLIWCPLFLVPWGETFIHVPLFTGINQCEHPQYGFYLYGERPFFDSFWLCLGEPIGFDMPWSWEWIRTSTLLKDGTWQHETKANRKGFKEQTDFIWTETYPYTYRLNSGKIQERIATVKVEEREWRWRGFQRLRFLAKINKTISVGFNEEVGERTGSWKGGVLGCGYIMRHGELPEHTLRRMERERKF